MPIAIAATLTEQAPKGNDRIGLGVQAYGQEIVRAMRRPSQWWSEPKTPPNTSPLATNDTTYQCDASLGAPNVNDCSDLDLFKLGAPSDSLIVAPGAPKVLTSSEFVVFVDAGKVCPS